MAAKKRKRAVGGGVSDILPDAMPQDVEIAITSDGDAPDAVDPSKPIEIPLADGSLEIDLNPQQASPKDTKFDDNLAEVLDFAVLNDIAHTLLEAIDEDDADRKEWLQQRADGLTLTALGGVERPGTNVGSSTAAVDGQTRVRDPLLGEAIDHFQAISYAELCPANGPCKAVYYGPETGDADKLAEDFEKDFNYYLSSGANGTATEYYPDTQSMLWWVGYASGMFKKVYSCPIRRRPVSESVDGEYLIIPSNVTDLDNAGRITHEINMRQSVMKRMQLLGVYRDIPLTTPNPTPSVLELKKADMTGMDLNQNRPEDQDYTLYECYCELDIPGFEHKDKGKPTGLPLPYRVVIDKDSRQILEIRRNWRHDDEDQKAKIPFVLFPYATGLSIYGTGLLQRLGNQAEALTAVQRELLDAGMFASFPGFIFANQAGRQLNNNFRVPAGGGVPFEMGGAQDIRQVLMPLPYKEPSAALVALRQQIRQEAQQFGNTANIEVGEGRQDAPVGTTLAMLEQATKVIAAVLKNLHAAQKRELNMLRDLFKEDPEALWRGNHRPAMGADQQARLARWRQALENCDLGPASDPNEPTSMHRLAKAQTLLQLTMGDPTFDQVAVKRRVFAMFKIDDFDALLNKNGPQPDPMMLAQIQMKDRELKLKEFQVAQKAQNDQRQLQSKEQIAAMQIAAKQGGQDDPYKGQEMGLKQQALDLQAGKLAVDSHNAQADRKSREAIEAMKIAQTVGVHPEADGVVDQQLQEMKPFLAPATANGPAPSMSDGGAVPEILPPDPDIDLAMAITQFLRDYKPRNR